MVGPPHPQSATFRHTDFTEPFRHNSNLYGAISSRLQRGWGETPVTSEQCQAICNQIKRRIEAIKKLRDEEQIFDVQAIHDLRAYCRYQKTRHFGEFESVRGKISYLDACLSG